mmetsp:Transcript_27266/g.84048  ORF Transcript_27266/g.84048 Transcript_27266/m.84048 type:complete len:208 (-) Transcript_27266:113-736(-)
MARRLLLALCIAAAQAEADPDAMLSRAHKEVKRQTLAAINKINGAPPTGSRMLVADDLSDDVNQCFVPFDTCLQKAIDDGTVRTPTTGYKYADDWIKDWEEPADDYYSYNYDDDDDDDSVYEIDDDEKVCKKVAKDLKKWCKIRYKADVCQDMWTSSNECYYDTLAKNMLGVTCDFTCKNAGGSDGATTCGVAATALAATAAAAALL